MVTTRVYMLWISTISGLMPCSILLTEQSPSFYLFWFIFWLLYLFYFIIVVKVKAMLIMRSIMLSDYARPDAVLISINREIFIYLPPTSSLMYYSIVAPFLLHYCRHVFLFVLATINKHTSTQWHSLISTKPCNLIAMSKTKADNAIWYPQNMLPHCNWLYGWWTRDDGCWTMDNGWGWQQQHTLNLLSIGQADRGFATNKVSFLSFYSTNGYVGFFWGMDWEKREMPHGLLIHRDVIPLQAGWHAWSTYPVCVLL